ncbi:hypothetical protein TWF481_001141 [Arthrobotrys musiformis]|uniref:NACHT domain-containing protein n=1 Tax=Arthrobotrys musiformis TaxID=47236 RepID=A0AAV9WVS1_9PEZI
MTFSQASPSAASDDPMHRAFCRFYAKLSPDERNKYKNAQITAEDLEFEVERLQANHKKLSKSLRIATSIQPLVSFLQRHESSVDTFVQANPFPAALVWGSIKVLLNLASYHIHYFESLVKMLRKLGDDLDIFRQYESLLRESVPVQRALEEVYFDIFIFLAKARKIFRKRGSLLFARTLWKTFQRDFGDTIEKFQLDEKKLQSTIDIQTTTYIKDTAKGIAMMQAEQIIVQQEKMEKDIEDAKEARKMSRNKIMNWVSDSDPAQDFDRESKRRIGPSGLWLLEQPAYKYWLSSSQNRLLRIVGSPGSGKTVISTTIIEDLGRQGQKQTATAWPDFISSCTAYFYCSTLSNQTQSKQVILCGLIKQILTKFEGELPECVTQCYEKSFIAGRSSLSAADDPEILMKAIAESVGNLYIVVDGLDEVADRDATIEALVELTKNIRNLKTVVLSREINEITNDTMTSYPIIKLDSSNTSQDVKEFIQSRLNDIKKKDSSKDFPPEVVDEISQKANGMFLWAKLMMDSLKNAISFEDALDIVSNTPATLDEFYDKILDRIVRVTNTSPNGRKIARTILMLMCAVARPLRWGELLCMYNINEEGVKAQNIFQSAVFEFCSPLIEQQPGTDIIRFVHLSVREFFVNASETNRLGTAGNFHFRESDAHMEVARRCLSYLLDPKANAKWEEKLKTKNDLPSIEEYAARYWGYHVTNSNYNDNLSRKMHTYLSEQSRRMTWIRKQLFRESSGFPLQHLIKIQKALHKWDTGNNSDKVKNERLDWIQDVGRVLVDIDSTDTNPKDQASGQSRITYFQKLMVIRDLSREYTIRQRLDEGETWMQEALQKRKEKYGEGHISTVWLLNSLGIIYDQQHRVQLSASTHEKALKIQVETWGEEHSETMWTINELGRVYRHLGRYDEAIKMHNRAFEILKKLEPDNVLQIAWTLNTLARAYRKQGSVDKALECHEEAIGYQKGLLEEDHPHILWATADLGRCYRDRGDLKKSAFFHRVCLDGRRKVLGSDHPDTLWAMNDLGLVLSEDGQMEEAKKLHEEALEGQKRLLGENHPHTLWSKKQIEEVSWEEVGSEDLE